MGGRRNVRALGLTLVVGLMVFAGAVGCNLSDLLPMPGAGPQIRFWAGHEVVPRGGCTVLHWQVSGAEGYPVFFNGREVASEGEEEVCPGETTTFELVVAAPEGPIKQGVTVRVEGQQEEPPPGEQPPGGPEVVMLFVEPDVIQQGGCAMLRWEVHPPEWPVRINGQEVPPGGEREECPQQTTTYELVVEAPGGVRHKSLTLQVQAGPVPQATSPAAPTTAPPVATTAPPAATTAPPAATPIPPSPTPTTFVPVWGQCSWVRVHPVINSHQPNTWCPNGSFLTGLDLDREGSYDAMDSPVVGQAQCCPLSVAQFSPWGQCSWEPVEKAGKNSHQPLVYCPNGQYLTGLDLDRIATDAMDSPGVGQGFCCPFGDPNKYLTWGSCSWVKVHPTINSHQPNTWCPNGSFLAGLDLDREGSYDPLDSPVVGQAYCCSPK